MKGFKGFAGFSPSDLAAMAVGGGGFLLVAGAMEAVEDGFLPAGVLLAMTGALLVGALVFGVAVAILGLPEPGLDPGSKGDLPWVAANGKEG